MTIAKKFPKLAGLINVPTVVFPRTTVSDICLSKPLPRFKNSTNNIPLRDGKIIWPNVNRICSNTSDAIKIRGIFHFFVSKTVSTSGIKRK